MPGLVVIDGNNLLYAMHAAGPLPSIGRETLVKIIERWAARGDAAVTLFFDGPAPQGPLAKQMASRHITVRFAAPQSADDLIVAAIQRQREPDRMLVVSDDTAIRHEARACRCRYCGATAFVSELFPSTPERPHGADSDFAIRPTAEKPHSVTDAEKEEWLNIFDDGEEDDPFDGFGAMMR